MQRRITYAQWLKMVKQYAMVYYQCLLPGHYYLWFLCDLSPRQAVEHAIQHEETNHAKS